MVKCNIWGQGEFFSKFWLQSLLCTTTYSVLRPQTLKGSPRTQHTKFCAHSGIKCPILTIIKDKYLSLIIVKMEHFTPEWGWNLVCYVTIRIHVFLSVPPDYGHQKKLFPLWLENNNGCLSNNFNPLDNWMVKKCLMEAVWVDCAGISKTLS